MDYKNLPSAISLIAAIIAAFATIVGFVDIISSDNPRSVILGTVSLLILIFIISLVIRKVLKFQRLFCRITSEKNVLTVKEAEEIKGRVQVLLDNKPVRDAQMMPSQFLCIDVLLPTSLNESYRHRPIRFIDQLRSK